MQLDRAEVAPLLEALEASSGETRAAIREALAGLEAVAQPGPARGFASVRGELDPAVVGSRPGSSWFGDPLPWLEDDVAPIAVTYWFEQALDPEPDVNAGADIVAWVRAYAERFRPELDGLFVQYRRAAGLGPWSAAKPDRTSDSHRILAWQIAWTVSRGGLHGLVPGLAHALASEDETQRTAAARLIVDVAANVLEPRPPRFGYGYESAAATVNPELSMLLSEAARAGVVPHVATVRPPAQRPAPPLPVPKAPPELPDEAAPPAARSSSPVGWVAGLAVLAASALAVAKWLFGWFSVDVEGSTPSDDVQCTVFAPPAAPAGASLLVQVFAHLPEEADAARAVARELDTAARLRGFRSLYDRVPRGARLDFELRLPGLEIDDAVASLVWQGRTEAVQFGVAVPEAMSPRSVIGTVSISRDGAPVGHVKFTLKVTADVNAAEPEPLGVEAKRYRVAFVSYASRDRDEVLRRVQVLQIAGLRYFQDVLTLEAGENWSEAIECAIRESDVFLLFWSSGAKESEWVRREVDYALALKAGDDLAAPEIRPVIIEGPPVIPPWDDLAHLHFNDRVLYFMSRPTT